jgi:Tol biopolymer transport system component
MDEPSRHNGNATPLEREIFEARRPAWSRDGKSIYFDSTRSGKPQIWKRTLDTGVTRPIAPTDSLAPLESFDGTTLFFTSGSTKLSGASKADNTRLGIASRRKAPN